jgi:hypothetical protein
MEELVEEIQNVDLTGADVHRALRVWMESVWLSNNSDSKNNSNHNNNKAF